MLYASDILNDGLDRLQEHLLGMRDGEALTCSDAARVSGLSQEVCRTVLAGLAQSGLMSHEADDRFVRRVGAFQPS